MASQLGLPNTRTASLRRTDMEISPYWRGFGGRNRNMWEQMDSTEGPVCTDKAPSQQVGCSSIVPSPWGQEKHIHRLRERAAHSHLSQPCPGRAAGTGHTCPASKPSGTQLRLAKEAPAPQRPSALCLPLTHRAPRAPRAPCAHGGTSSLGLNRSPSLLPAQEQGRTSLGGWDTQTWAHDQAPGPCASPATHIVTATASCPPLMCQHKLLPPLSQPRAGQGRGQE